VHQGRRIAKPHEARVKAMLHRMTLVIEDEDSTVLKSHPNPTGVCADMVQPDCFM
jgi:hypothetical protein